MALDVYYHALNVGVIDRGHLHRIDLARMRLASEQQTNLFCTAVGKAFLRPGTEYLGETLDSDEARLLPFVGGNDSAFLMEFGEFTLRIWDCDTDALVTRAAVSTTVTNGDFASGVGWTLASTAGQTSQISGGQLDLSARAHGGKASAKRTITVSAPDQSVEHGLRIIVARGPVQFRLGTTDGGDELIEETTLATGEHSLAFTPGAATIYIQFTSERQTKVLVDSAQIEAAGVMEIPTPYGISTDDVQILQTAQSLDVVFVACDGVKQQRIERRGDHSWSVVDYDVDDGPFTAGRTATVTLTPGATEGNTTLTASEPFFTSEHIGALFRIYHDGQKIETFLVGLNSFTPTFIITGVNETDYNDRDWSVTFANGASAWVGTIRTQRSFDGEDIEFHDMRRAQSVSTVDITANASYTNDDNEDNAIEWVRYIFQAYTSGEVSINTSYDGGGGVGIARVVSISSNLVANIEVLKPFSGKHASKDWQESEWSERMGYPAGVAFHEGRLWWFGADRVWGSVSDGYDSFDEDFIGDSGPLIRSIALGGRNLSRWGFSISNLFLGTDARVATVRGSSLDEIMTPANFGLHNVDEVGGNGVSPVALSDDRGLFCGVDGVTLYEVVYDGTRNRFTASQFSKLTTDLYTSGILQLARAKLPDQRVFVTNDDADATMVVYEPRLEIAAPIPFSTTDLSGVEDVITSMVTVPGPVQDRVYVVVRRTVDGNTVHYVEKMALDSEAKPGPLAKCVDSFVVYGADGDGVLTGLDHLEGRTVYVWADSDAVNDANGDAQAFVVTGGQIDIGVPVVTSAVVGLGYRGRYKSARFAYGLENSTSMLKNRTIAAAGFIFEDYVRSGVRIGGEFDNALHPLDRLSLMKNGTAATDIVIGPEEDEGLRSIYSPSAMDARLVIECQSPKPCGIKAIVVSLEPLG